MKNEETAQIFYKIKELTEGYKGEEILLNRLDWLKSLLSAYQKYLPARVIEKIKVDPSAKRIEGERRYITVLFADLSGFTALSETMDAEEIANIINDFFTRMVKIVHKYGGSVDKFLGDALMVLFGAPVAHHDDPERAVRAALEMQQEMERFNAEKKFASPLSMSVGINTGPAVALNVGSDERMEYTVIGDTVNLAARLESVSGPHEIIISHFTYERIADIVDAEKRPPVKVKGKKKPVVNYLVKGIQEHYRLPEITKIKFVGREAELNAIRQSLNQTKNNILTVVAICGEPGSGKTRLGIEGELLAREGGFSTFAVRCVPYEMNIPYNSFIMFFNNYFRLKREATEEERKLLISLKLKNLGLSLDNILPYIGTIYGMEFPEVQSLPADELKRRIINGIKDILLKEAKTNPLFIRFEDMQWADPTSIEILDYLLKELKHSPILFMFDYRSDWAFPWLGIETCKNVMLRNFTKEETAFLIKSILQGERCAPEIENLIFEKSIGNPLFAIEILKMLLIKNGIRRTKEGFIPTERLKKLEAAESISSVILDQIDRMSELDRRILQYASVLGRTFEPSLLAKILNIPEENLLEDLQRLEHFEGVLVFNPATNTYDFISPTTYEVVYGSLFKAKRKELHAEIGRELERIPEERIYENLEKLAFHFARSNHERKGIYYLKSAAEKSYRLYALKETSNFFNQALELLSKKELTHEEMQDKMEIQRRLGWVLRILGNPMEAIKHQKKSQALARKLLSFKDEAGANINIGKIYQEMGNFKKAINYWQRAKKIAKAIGDRQIETLAINNIGTHYLQIGDMKRAYDSFIKVLNLSKDINDRRGTAFANLNLGTVMERKGEFEKAIEYYEYAYSIFEEIGDKENTLRSLHQMAISQMLMGNTDQCLKNLNDLVDLSTKYGDRIMESLALGSLGEAYGRMWQLDKSRDYFSRSLAIAQMIGEQQHIMGMHINIGDVQLFVGNLKSAIDHHHEAIAIADQIQDCPNCALAHRSIGWDYFYMSDYKKAEQSFDTSYNLFQTTNDKRNSIISMLAGYAVRTRFGHVTEIERTLNEIERMAKELNDLEILAIVLDTKADIMIGTREYEDAKPILEQLSEIARQIGNKRIFAWTIAKLAEVQFRIGLLDAGEKNLEKSLAIAGEIGDKILEAHNYINKAEFFFKRGEYANALNILMKASELANHCGTKELNAKDLSLAGKIYTKISREREAEECLNRHKKIVAEITKGFSQKEREYYEKFID